MIKRYSFYSDIYHDIHEQEDASGEHIRIVDYNTLLLNYNNLVEFLIGYNSIKQCDGLQRKIEACKEFIKEVEE